MLQAFSRKWLCKRLVSIFSTYTNPVSQFRKCGRNGPDSRLGKAWLAGQLCHAQPANAGGHAGPRTARPPSLPPAKTQVQGDDADLLDKVDLAAEHAHFAQPARQDDPLAASRFHSHALTLSELRTTKGPRREETRKHPTPARRTRVRGAARPRQGSPEAARRTRAP